MSGASGRGAAPVVSVVVPAYNAERLIGATLDSILAQRDVALEVIVVDDRSSDGTAAIVQRRAQIDPRVRCVSTPHNFGGPAGPRNLGVREAAGDWVAFCDADDLWHPDKLAAQLACAVRTGAGLVCTATDMFHDGTTPFPDAARSREPQPDRLIGLWAMLLKNRVATSSVMCLRAALLATPGFDTRRDMIAVEDYDMWLRLMCLQDLRVVRVERRLVAYRLLQGSLSASKWRQALKIIRVHREIFALKGWQFAFPFLSPILIACYISSWLYLRGQVRRTPTP